MARTLNTWSRKYTHTGGSVKLTYRETQLIQILIEFEISIADCADKIGISLDGMRVHKCNALLKMQKVDKHINIHNSEKRYYLNKKIRIVHTIE